MIPRPQTPLSAEKNAPRIVFFGMPSSGKSDLLASFKSLASGDAEDEPIELSPSENPTPLVPHRFLVDLPDVPGSSRAVVLLDCDGQACARLLNQPGELARNKARGELGNAIRDADALVLVIQARAERWQIDESFAGFNKFLKHSAPAARSTAKSAAGRSF